ncbi:MAG: helix-turn-helix transcriptional regulator [bacterium]|nr:helix-turn-helix transcriptional regulator [bacterium]
MITRTGRLIQITFPQRLLKRYVTGELNHHDVARIVGVSSDVARRELGRAGMDTSRSTRKRLQSSRRLGLASVDDTVTQLYRQSQSLRQIAKRLGLTQEGIRQILLRNQEELRPRGARSPVLNGSGGTAGRERFATCLRRLRETAKLTRTQLAAQSGLTRAAIWSLEKALRLPAWTTLLKLSNGLGVSLQALGVSATPPDAGVLNQPAR